VSSPIAIGGSFTCTATGSSDPSRTRRTWVQEALLAAWRWLEGFAGRGSLRAWLYRIATNRCENALRGSARRPRELKSLAELADPTRRTEPI
jgi:DNA-directed RNA polymerase specialized sigma24 family protein